MGSLVEKIIDKVEARGAVGGSVGRLVAERLHLRREQHVLETHRLCGQVVAVRAVSL